MAATSLTACTTPSPPIPEAAPSTTYSPSTSINNTTSLQPYQSIESSGNGNSKSASTLLFIVDNSSSLNEKYYGSVDPHNTLIPNTKLSLEKQLISRINTVLPNDYSITSGLRSFGYGPCLNWKKTKLLQPVLPHSPESLDRAINKIECAGGGTPAHHALKAAASDISNSNQNKAIIILSDGNFSKSPAIQEIRELKKLYDNQLCVYPIWVGNGNDIQGYRNLRALSASSCCGFTTKAQELADNGALQTYVNTVLNDFGSPTDNDCDGVANNVPDQCPGTPIDTVVNAAGCPLDDDRDGVLNPDDNCPNTPFTAPVNYAGCWNIPPVLFQSDKSHIEAQFKPELNNVFRVMRNNPELHIKLSGNTDNQASFKYNKQLSQRRANAIKRYAEQQGISPARIKTGAYSFSKPVRSNNTSTGRRRNRRVDLKIWAD